MIQLCKKIHINHLNLLQTKNKYILQQNQSSCEVLVIYQACFLCFRKFSDFEEARRQEVDVFNNKLHASQLERKALAGQVIELTAETRRSQTESKLMHKSVK